MCVFNIARYKMDYDIKNGKLQYKGKDVLENKKYPFDKYTFIEKIGEGSNGITYHVKHETLEISQIIKIFKCDKDKSVLEAKKNALLQNSDVIPAVSDAGVLSYPVDNVYSIMPNVDGITLSQWIEVSDYMVSVIPKESVYLKNIILQNCLNVSIVLLKSYMKLYNNNITHGDLHPNNILIDDDFLNAKFSNNKKSFICKALKKKCDYEACLHQINSSGKHIRCGTITANSINLRLIDLGTSQIEGTLAEIGNERDIYFLIDNLRKLLKNFFTKNEFNSFFNFTYQKCKNGEVDILDRTFKSVDVPQSVVVDFLLRIVMYSNVFHGILSNNVDMYQSDVMLMNSIMREKFAVHSKDIDISTVDNVVYELINEIEKSMEDLEKINDFEYVNWSNMWVHFKSKYAECNLFKTVDFRDNEFVLKKT